MNKNTRKNKKKFTKIQNNLIKTVHYFSENNNLKSDHVLKFELILDLFITKYESSSASISESEKQINLNNVTDLLKKILDSDKKDDLIDFDKDSQDLSSLIQIVTES